MSNELVIQWEELRKYISCMHKSVLMWRRFFAKREEIDWLSRAHVEQWFDRITMTFDVLEKMYVFDRLDSLYVRHHSSGFPTMPHIQRLVGGTKELSLGGEITEVDSLKNNLIDDIFTRAEVNIAFLERIAKASAQKDLASASLILPYRFASLEERKGSNGRRAFVCSWERYTLQPLPVKYVMLFEVSSSWIPDKEAVTELSKVLQGETSVTQTLEEIARVVDLSNAQIHPKWISRIMLGPVLVSHLTQDKHELQRSLDHIAEKDQFVSASSVVYEYLVSEEESPVSEVFDTNGQEHTCVQKFACKHSGELWDRRVTHMERHFFAPHRAVQQLSDTYRKEIGHQLTVYEQEVEHSE